MKYLKIGLIALAALLGVTIDHRQSAAQPAIDPQALAELQGRWISRFEDNDTEIEITGREVRVIRAKQVTFSPNTPANLRYQPQPGDLVAIIESTSVLYSAPAQMEGKPARPVYNIRFRCMSNHGSSYRMTDGPSCLGTLGAFTHFEQGPGGLGKPVFEYRALSPVGINVAGDNMLRPDVKRRITGQ